MRYERKEFMARGDYRCTLVHVHKMMTLRLLVYYDTKHLHKNSFSSFHDHCSIELLGRPNFDKIIIGYWLSTSNHRIGPTRFKFLFSKYRHQVINMHKIEDTNYMYSVHGWPILADQWRLYNVTMLSMLCYYCTACSISLSITYFINYQNSLPQKREMRNYARTKNEIHSWYSKFTWLAQKCVIPQSWIL